MDSDALYHLLDIKLINVHDTSVWHYSITGRIDQNLKATLEQQKLSPNKQRDGNVYAKNNAFWAVRPLTVYMIEWASGDVSSMIELHKVQLSLASAIQSEKAKAASMSALEIARSAKTAKVSVRSSAIGKFIGKKGANLRCLQHATNTKISSYGPSSSGAFIVYYNEEKSLDEVQRCAREA